MSWIILLAGILNFFLCLIVWLRKPSEKINYSFAIFSLSTTISILFDYIFRLNPKLIILQSSYAFATLVPLTALILTLEITGINLKSISLSKKLFIILVHVFFFIICFVDGYIVERIDTLTILGYKGQLGPMFIVYALFFFLYLATLIYLLNKSQKKSTGILKMQLRFIMIGILSYGLTALIFSLILPTYFNIFDFTLLDAPGLILFVGFTAYAILKLHYLNIKTIATELLVFTLSLFLFIRALLATELFDVISNWILFAIVVVVGIFLIRSVIKEIQQREHIEKLAEDLGKANVKLTDLNRQKSEFVSFATHQLRAPLTAMKGYSSLILEGDMGQIGDEVRQGVSRIFESTNTLVNIVDDYLNVSRIELGTMKYSFEIVDIKQLIEDAIAELKPSIDKSKLTFSFNVGSNSDWRIKADPSKLKQVFVNLIDNAMKYTPSGSITANLSHDPVKHIIKFDIKDTGIGIAPEILPKLFEKWSRAENANKINIKGTGLGLYVVKEMISAHNGKIWVESSGEGKGSVFHVELPTNTGE